MTISDCNYVVALSQPRAKSSSLRKNMYSRGREEEVLAREILLELLESRTFTVLFQRLLVLVTRIEVSETVCGMSKSTVLRLNHADELGAVFVWSHRSVDLVAVGIFLVLLDMCRSLLDQIQHLLPLSMQNLKALWPELLACLLRLALPGSHHCDNIHSAGRHACRCESGEE